MRKLGDREHDGDKVCAVINTTTPDRLDVDVKLAAETVEAPRRIGILWAEYLVVYH